MAGIEEVREAVRSVATRLMLKDPLMGIMLKRTWIYASDSVPLAATDGIRIYINPKTFMKLKPQDQVHVLVHELMHIALEHPTRGKSLKRRLGEMRAIVNIAADAKANEHVIMEYPPLDLRPVTCRDLRGFGIGEEECRRSSFEELVMKLLERAERIRCACSLASLASEGEFIEDQGEGKEVINEGDEDEKDMRDAEAMAEKARRKFAEALATAKAIGRVPGYAERLAQEVLKPRIDWRSLLRKYLLHGPKVKRTWSRLSRKLPDVYPGKMTMGRAKSVVLVDTSGSISDKELAMFISEVYGMLHDSDIVLIPWDATVYEPVILRKPDDVKKLKLKGGGGTMIKDALELVDRKYSNAENIIILSDWHIGDLGDDRVKELLRKYSDRIIAVTTSAKPPDIVRKVVRLE